MPRLFQHNSNRLEVLGDWLADLIRNGLPSNPMEPVLVVVQTPGIARWLNLRLADAHGCSMNIEYLYPRNFVEEMLSRFLGDEKVNRMDPEALAWRVFGMLPRLIEGDSRFEQLKSYLSDGSQLKRLQLAEKIAGTFDQYLTYRPKLLLDWEAGSDARDWQAELWRQLADKEDQTPVELGRLSDQLEGAEPRKPLPEKIYVFGVSTLPPLYAGFLNFLGNHSEVHLLNLAPSREFWGDARSERQRLREGDETPAETHPLLSSMGKQGRDFINVLIDQNFAEGDGAYEDAAVGSLLGRLQNDILGQRWPTQPEDDDREPYELLPLDTPRDSVQVVACSGPMRELEQLKDALLDCFDSLPGLRPRDILVLTPDIESMAPYIDAVFGSTEQGAQNLPYSIADRGPRGESRLLDAFFAVLELPGKRLTTRELVAVLEHPAIAARFGFDESELETLRGWIQESGVRWGRDAAHRDALGIGPEAQNAWRAGIERLLLGSAMRENGSDLYAGILPFDAVEGSEVDLLGRFCDAVETLLDMAAQMERPRPLAEWAELLASLTQRLLEVPAGEAHEPSALRNSLAELASQAELLEKADEPLDIQAMRHALEGLLRNKRPPGGFLGGGITFAELKPMRSVPARVICLLGMDETAFPRNDVRLPFDRVAQDPRPGDRSQRNGDRYLFLETLLSARERLYISYRGRDKEGRSLPPSVLVSELQDYLGQMLGDDGSSKPDALGLLQRAPLQAFDPSRFEAGAPQSYSPEGLRAALALVGERRIESFLGSELPPSTGNGEVPTVRLDEFIRFFQNPARAFLEQRLRMRLPHEAELLPEDEPLSLNNLESWQLGDRLLRGLLDGSLDPDRELELQRAAGVSPWGRGGELVFYDTMRRAERMQKRLQEYLSPEPEVYQGTVDVDCGDAGRFKLLVDSGPVHNGRMLGYKLGKLKENNRLSAWLRWLAVCACREVGAPTATAFVCEDSGLRFTRPDLAEQLLADVGKLYLRGLNSPLHFFPVCSYKAAKEPKRNGEPDPLKRAENEWNRRDFSGGGKLERDDPSVQVIYGETGPFPAYGTEVVDVAQHVWLPCIEHEDKL